MPSSYVLAGRVSCVHEAWQGARSLARAQIGVSLLSFSISHFHVIWGRVLEGTQAMALPLTVRLAIFAGFSACAFHGCSWSMRTARISLFVATLSVLKHAGEGAWPYAAMLSAGLVYPLRTYFFSVPVRELLRPLDVPSKPGRKRLRTLVAAGIRRGLEKLKRRGRMAAVVCGLRWPGAPECARVLAWLGIPVWNRAPDSSGFAQRGVGNASTFSA